MKGVIAMCLHEMVANNFGEDKWKNILSLSGLPENQQFYSHHDVEGSKVIEVISNACKVLNISMEQAADAFGEYWMTKFAPKKYYAFILPYNNAKDLLLNMDQVHKKLGSKENARPPHFKYEEISDKVITMEYFSKRKLEVFWIGLIKGVGAYFKEDIQIKKLGNSKVELTFS